MKHKRFNIRKFRVTIIKIRNDIKTGKKDMSNFGYGFIFTGDVKYEYPRNIYKIW